MCFAERVNVLSKRAKDESVMAMLEYPRPSARPKQAANEHQGLAPHRQPRWL
jgi:hypothetical protein